MLYYILWPVIWIVMRIIVGLLGGLRVENANRVPARGAVIIAPNHISFADPPIVGMTVRRPAWYLATDEMFAIPFLGPLAKIMRGIPIHQDSPDRAALRRTIDLLKKGEAFVIFPEGHVSKDGRLQSIQAGTIMIAVQTGAPIVPVGIIATDRLMPPHQWRIRHAGRRIEIRFGESISVERLTGGLKGRAGLDYGVRMLTVAIASLSGQDPYPDTTEEPAGAAQNGQTVAERGGIRV